LQGGGKYDWRWNQWTKGDGNTSTWRKWNKERRGGQQTVKKRRIVRVKGREKRGFITFVEVFGRNLEMGSGKEEG